MLATTVLVEALRPVSTQENKHRIGLDFFPSCIIHTAEPKKVENTSDQLFIIRLADHRFKLEQKIGTESPCTGSILFRSGPIRRLFSVVEIGLNEHISFDILARK